MSKSFALELLDHELSALSEGIWSEELTESVIDKYEWANDMTLDCSVNVVIDEAKELLPMHEPLSPKSRFYQPPTPKQLNLVSDLSMYAFPNDGDYRQMIYRLAQRMDRRTISELIGNLQRLGDEPTYVQIGRLKDLCSHYRFGVRFAEEIEERKAWTSYKVAKETIEWCEMQLNNFENLYCSYRELKQLNELSKHADGVDLFEKFSLNMRDENYIGTFVNRDNYDSLKEMLTERANAEDRAAELQRLDESRSIADIVRDGWANESYYDDNEDRPEYAGYSGETLLYK